MSCPIFMFGLFNGKQQSAFGVGNFYAVKYVKHLSCMQLKDVQCILVTPFVKYVMQF